jgi:hypothetical protein
MRVPELETQVSTSLGNEPACNGIATSGLGRVKTVLREVNSESQAQRKAQAAIAAIRRLVPMMFMTRVRL